MDLKFFDDISASDYESLLFSTKKNCRDLMHKKWMNTVVVLILKKDEHTFFFLCFIWMAGILERNLQFAVFFS
jgi:hypothetical protein